MPSSTARVEYDPNNLPENVFLWHIDDAQADRISALLKIDFSSLGIAGNFVYGAPAKCRACGKLSGLDDFIYTGLKMAAHKPEFMIKALTERMPSSSEQLPHTLDCCLCDTTYIEIEVRLRCLFFFLPFSPCHRRRTPAPPVRSGTGSGCINTW